LKFTDKFALRLSNKVDIDDVREAERLLKEAIQLAAFNPETGEIDMDLLTTGFNTITWAKAYENFKEQSYENLHEREFDRAIRFLEREG
ncbi:17076_t:CDS:2, partial [Acaulospora colombiana]